jgi:hypothetical protein
VFAIVLTVSVLQSKFALFIKNMTRLVKKGTDSYLSLKEG